MQLTDCLFAVAFACSLFPPGTLSRQECEHRERQGVQHPELRPHVQTPPIRQNCAEARAEMRWSEMPCAGEKTKVPIGKASRKWEGSR
jgi:hypothetical protein